MSWAAALASALTSRYAGYVATVAATGVAANIPVQGHQYSSRTELGETKLSEKEIFKIVSQRSPEYFPIECDKPLAKVGDTAELTFLGTKNPVKVTEITGTSVTLQAGEGHTFEGFATHAIAKEGDKAYYEVVGINPNPEVAWKMVANTVFGNLAWPTLIQNRTKALINEKGSSSST